MNSQARNALRRDGYASPRDLRYRIEVARSAIDNAQTVLRERQALVHDVSDADRQRAIEYVRISEADVEHKRAQLAAYERVARGETAFVVGRGTR